MSAQARFVLQQCVSARLMVKPDSADSPAEYVHIGRGMVVFVCFMKEASSEIVQRAVKSILEVRLSYCVERKKHVSIIELPGSVLIVPQATLGGKVKGKMMQYHNNIDKDEGARLYQEFVHSIQKIVEGNGSNVSSDCIVKHGTYGNQQVLSMDTNGPYTHIIDV